MDGIVFTSECEEWKIMRKRTVVLKYESHIINRTSRCEKDGKTVWESLISDPGERRNNNKGLMEDWKILQLQY